MKSYEHFVYAPLSGAPGNEYRIAEDRVQFRILIPGDSEPAKGPWHTLDRGDLLIHFSLRTAVHRWLVAHERIVMARASERPFQKVAGY
jgi:hypothetical protein